MKNKNLIFEGISTALITPFSDGRIDFLAFSALIDYQIESGIDALTVCGTTGESSCLTDGEKLALFEYAVQKVGGKVPVIAGVGCSDSQRTAATCAAAAELGCDALLIVAPYYNRPTDTGIYEHYKLCSVRSGKPIIAYNIPARTGISIPIPVLKRLFEEGYICGLKEASGDLSRAARIAFECEGLHLYSGNDDQTLPFAALGGKGVISVSSNVLPSEFCSLYRTFKSGNVTESASIQKKLTPFINALFSEVNPIGIKYAAALLGYCDLEYRLPLCPPSEQTQKSIETELRKLHPEKFF